LPISDRMVVEPIALEASDLEPGRRADHALMARGACSALSCLFAIGAFGVWCVVRGRSRGWREVVWLGGVGLGRRGWMMVIGIGVVLPFVVLLAARFLAPLGWIEESLRMGGLVWVPFGWAALALVVVLASGWIARRRLPGVFTRSGGLKGVLLGGVILGYVLMWWLPWLPRRFLSGMPWLVLIPGGLLIAVEGFRVVFGDSARNRAKLAVADVVVPSLLVAMVISAVLVPVFRFEERWWFARDEVMEPTATGSQFERRTTERLRAELQAVLGE